MKRIMPQEIEVWYLIPALRRELSQIFIGQYGMSQKDAARLLGITEPAISQYLKAKRGSELKFTKKELAEIKKAAQKIKDDSERSMDHLYQLCVMFRGSKSICDMHRKYDKSVAKGCDICMEE